MNKRNSSGATINTRESKEKESKSVSIQESKTGGDFHPGDQPTPPPSQMPSYPAILNNKESRPSSMNRGKQPPPVPPSEFIILQ